MIYCGNDVCKDELKKSEEHPLLYSLLEDINGIEFFNENKYIANLDKVYKYISE